MRPSCVALAALLLVAGAAAQVPDLAPFLTQASAIQPWMVTTRRKLHQTPELLYNLVNTTAIIRQELTKMGIKFKFPVARMGIVAEIGTGSGPIVALRADMDGLPIPEASGLPFASTTGLSHTCGHDVHTTMLLGAAKMLKGMESQLKGTVRLLFTPAEEGGAGCHLMVKEGALNGVGAAFGFHVWPGTPTGTIQAVTTGQAQLAASSLFDLNVTGVGGHGAMPHLAIDPVTAAAQIINSLQTLVSRETDPMAANVVSVTKLQGANSFNIIPETVRMGGTVRAVSLEAMDNMRARVEAVAKGVAAAHRARADITWVPFVEDVTVYPPTINNPAVANWGLAVAKRLVSSVKGASVGEATPVMGAEDFAFIAQKVPSTFFFLGIRNEALGSVYGVHNPQFRVDEDVMRYGAALHTSLATEWLRTGGRRMK